jgi:hypothetical protein
VSTPSADDILYVNDIDCTGGSSGTCAAVGATMTGAVILASGSGPSGSWSDQTPSGLSGYVTNGIPIEINNSGLLPNTYATSVTAGATSNATQLPVLYPFASGYSLWAADCQTEAQSLSSYTAQAATIPGGTSGVTVPLGLLSLQLTHAATGLPYFNATVTITAATSGCPADTYTLQTTDAAGLSRTEVPYGTYSVSINGSTKIATLVVSGNSSAVQVTSGSTTTTTTYTLPTPVPVSA